MKAVTVVGILLILLGIVSLAYGGITYTHQKNVLNIGSTMLRKLNMRRFLCRPSWADWH